MVPHKKHQATLKLIHEGHLGLDKCKLRLKDTVYWSDLNDQHEKLILNCELCLKYSHSKCKPKPTTSLGQEIIQDKCKQVIVTCGHCLHCESADISI